MKIKWNSPKSSALSHFFFVVFVFCINPFWLQDFVQMDLQLSGTLCGEMTHCFHFITLLILYATMIMLSCVFVLKLSLERIAMFFILAGSVEFESVGARAESADSP